MIAREVFSSSTGEDFYSYTTPTGFEMLLSAEAYDIAHAAGWRATVGHIEAGIDEAVQRPFGPNSIDHAKHEIDTRKQRTMHRLEQDMEDALGLPIAIKGTGLQPSGGVRMTYREQFEHMSALSSLQRELHPKGIGGLFFINRPLAYIEYPTGDDMRPYQEWVVMDRVEGSITEHMSRFDFEDYYHDVFSADTYPDLVDFMDANGGCNPNPRREVKFKFLRSAVATAFDLEQITSNQLADLNGKNVMVSNDPDGLRKFTAIDLQARPEHALHIF